MSALLSLPGIGKPTSCVIARYHRPKPLRFVLHHVLPQVCGGQSVAENLVSLCDNDHYAVHALMTWLLHTYGPVNASGSSAFDLAASLPAGTRAQRGLAVRGYLEAVAAGTAGKLPNEGTIG